MTLSARHPAPARLRTAACELPSCVTRSIFNLSTLYIVILARRSPGGGGDTLSDILDHTSEYCPLFPCRLFNPRQHPPPFLPFCVDARLLPNAQHPRLNKTERVRGGRPGRTQRKSHCERPCRGWTAVSPP